MEYKGFLQIKIVEDLKDEEFDIFKIFINKCLKENLDSLQIKEMEMKEEAENLKKKIELRKFYIQKKVYCLKCKKDY